MSEEPKILAPTPDRSIAYHKIEGQSPGVLFLTGFKSDMEGSKALALENHCRAEGRSFLRFDYRGHGASSGAFIDGCIGDWTQDALDVLDHLSDGPQILVGSSMGGWIMLLAALARPQRVAGLVGIAAAPDFTEDLIRSELDAEQRAALEKNGRIDLPSDYDETPTPITGKLLEDGAKHLTLRKRLPLDIPVRLIHGQRDPDVPWRTALRLADMLRSDDVEITLIKSGEHRLSEESQIALLTRTVSTLAQTILDNQKRGKK